MSQPQLAKLIGVSNAAVALWETGRNKPQLIHLRAVAGALNVPVSDLLSDEIPGHIVRDPEALELIALFDNLGSEQRAAILAMCRVLARKC